MSAAPILQVDGLWGHGPSGGGGEGGDGRANMAENIVNSALRYRAQAPLIDSLLRELGFDGGNIASAAAGVFERGHLSGGEAKK